MKLRSLTLIVLAVAVVGAAGCNLPGNNLPGVNATGLPPQYSTVSAVLTATAGAFIEPTQELTATVSTPSQETTSSPTIAAPQTAALPTVTVTPTPSVPCNLAKAGIPIDVTIADDSRMKPGDQFVKTWRLVNAGTCAWTQQYSVVWFSGDDLGVRRDEPLARLVNPGESVDLSVDMIAPARSGVYQSNWKLRDAKGDLFGIGPGGGAPFWARIEVVALETNTPTVSPPQPTVTPAVLGSGTSMLLAKESVDLETGNKDVAEQSDLLLDEVESVLKLQFVNGSKAVLVGGSIPGLSDCRGAALSAEPVIIGTELEGSYLCLQTSQSLPGWVKISSVDMPGSGLGIEYLVWSIP
ncbi:MAG: hypothetical protein HY835_13545 [Anaerolineae bacterium]|nr:hypothetical protein [Anaerolineae bacterium]